MVAGQEYVIASKKKRYNFMISKFKELVYLDKTFYSISAARFKVTTELDTAIHVLVRNVAACAQMFKTVGKVVSFYGVFLRLNLT